MGAGSFFMSLNVLQKNEHQWNKDSDDEFDASSTDQSLRTFQHEQTGEGDQKKAYRKDVREPGPPACRIVMEPVKGREEFPLPYFFLLRCAVIHVDFK